MREIMTNAHKAKRELGLTLSQALKGAWADARAKYAKKEEVKKSMEEIAMKNALELLIANGLTHKGFSWNYKVYGNAIYLIGNKVVLPMDVLELAKNRFTVSNKYSNNVENNVVYCNHKNTPFTAEATKALLVALYNHRKLDTNTDKFEQEVVFTILARKEKAFNSLTSGLSRGGVMLNSEKEELFNQMVSFVIN
jgi:hypothetical protein